MKTRQERIEEGLDKLFAWSQDKADVEDQEWMRALQTDVLAARAEQRAADEHLRKSWEKSLENEGGW